LNGLAKALVLDKRPYLKEEEHITTLHILTKERLQSLIKREKKQKMYWMIGKILIDSSTSSGIKRVDIPATVTNEPFPIGPDPKTWKGLWQSMTDPNEIVRHIKAANICQYNQAAPTPFTSGQIAEDIGPLASSDAASSLLNGSIPASWSSPLPEVNDLAESLSTLHIDNPNSK
jgi:hypothetical protein